MMKQFSIRIKPGSEESLLSYLSRSCARNYAPFREIGKYVTVDSRPLRNFSIVDIYPESSIELKKLSYLVGLKQEEILSHTFSNAIDNFNKAFVGDSPGFGKDVALLFERNELQFCPLCLKENGRFNLLWRVKSISMCDRHHVNLVSTCSRCHHKQQVVKSKFNYTQGQNLQWKKVRCQNCGEELVRQVNNSSSSDIISLQTKIYKNWRYLIDFDGPIPYELQGMSMEQSLAVRILYVSQQEASTFDIYHSSHVLTRGQIQNLLRVVRGDAPNRYVTMFRFMSFLERVRFSITEFLDVRVPKLFIDSLMHEEQYKPEFGTCLAPWCHSYGSNKRMKEISINRYTTRNAKYAIRAGCLDCCIEYGMSHDGVWESVDGFIGKLQEIKRHLDEGKLVQEISRMGLPWTALNPLVAYLSYHGMAPDYITHRYTPTFSLEGIVHQVKQLANRNATTARKMFGWSTAHFYYVMASKNVRYHVLFEASKASKNGVGPVRLKDHSSFIQRLSHVLDSFLESNIEITFSALARELGLRTANKLYRLPFRNIIIECRTLQVARFKKRAEDSLKTKIVEFRKIKQDKCENITTEGIYDYIGISRKVLKNQNPGIVEFITDLMKDINERKFQSKVQRVEETKKELVNNGVYPSMLKVSYMSGVSTSFIRRNPEVRELLRGTD